VNQPAFFRICEKILLVFYDNFVDFFAKIVIMRIFSLDFRQNMVNAGRNGFNPAIFFVKIFSFCHRQFMQFGEPGRGFRDNRFNFLKIFFADIMIKIMPFNAAIKSAAKFFGVKQRSGNSKISLAEIMFPKKF